MSIKKAITILAIILVCGLVVGYSYNEEQQAEKRDQNAPDSDRGTTTLEDADSVMRAEYAQPIEELWKSKKTNWGW